MTVIVGWIAHDNHSKIAPYSSVYLISDSRYSWNSNLGYNYGRKLFTFKNSPDIIAYCGDVVFPVSIISQIVELADNGLLFTADANSDQRNFKIYQQIQNQFLQYPEKYFLTTNIYHITRDCDKTFKFYRMSYVKHNKSWMKEELKIENHESHIVFCDGSGKKDFEKHYSDYNSPSSLNSRTSRNIYQCFSSLLQKNLSKTYGGSPQLVGLYRSKGNGINFGIIQEQKRYYLGSPVQDLLDYGFVEWRNENFEICDGESMKIKSKAMRQPNPFSKI